MTEFGTPCPRGLRRPSRSTTANKPLPSVEVQDPLQRWQYAFAPGGDRGNWRMVPGRCPRDTPAIHDPMNHHDRPVNKKAAQFENRSAPLRTQVEKLFQSIFKYSAPVPLIAGVLLDPPVIPQVVVPQNIPVYTWPRIAAEPRTSIRPSHLKASRQTRSRSRWIGARGSGQDHDHNPCKRQNVPPTHSRPVRLQSVCRWFPSSAFRSCHGYTRSKPSDRNRMRRTFIRSRPFLGGAPVLDSALLGVCRV